MRATKVGTILVMLAMAGPVCGQPDFFNLRGSAYLDNLGDWDPSMKGDLAVGVQAEEPFFTKRRSSLGYFFSWQDYDYSSDAGNDAQSVIPELFLETRTGQAVNFGFSYSRQSAESGIYYSSESDVYDGSISLSQELLRFFTDAQTTSLWVGGAFGYQRAEIESDSLVGIFPTILRYRTDLEVDTFSASPSLVFMHLFSSKWQGMLVPSYHYGWLSTEVEGLGHSSAEASGFKFLARTDYHITSRWTLTASGMWLRDFSQQGSLGDRDRNWARFGGAVRYGIWSWAGIRMGYSYDAFHPDFDAHAFLARIEMAF